MRSPTALPRSSRTPRASPSLASSSSSSSSSSSPPLLLTGWLSAVALFLFGKFCLDLGIMIGHESCPNHCLDAVGGHRPPATGLLFGGKKSAPPPPGLADEWLENHETTPRTTGGTGPRSSMLRAVAAMRALQERRTSSSDADGGEDERIASSSSSTTAPSNLVVGMTVVKRNDFAAVIDTGVPINPTDARKDDVVILYTSESSLPSDQDGPNMDMSVSKAIENCRTMKVVLTEQDQDSNCIAVMGHVQESFHVHRFHRLPDDDKAAGGAKREVKAPVSEAEETLEGGPAPGDAYSSAAGPAGRTSEVVGVVPLRPVPRTVETRGVIRDAAIPKREDVDEYLPELVEYLTRLRGTLDALRPVAEAAARENQEDSTRTSRRRRAIVAMTVNSGQSELFVNFVCSCRSRGIDTSHVLLFATDAPTAELAKSMGVHVFEVKDAYGPMPTTAANNYGDKSFKKMVLAKVYSVHLLVQLGYDVLLQDVDVVWFRNPLEYFLDPSNGSDKWDLQFQDDGSRLPRFAPYFANTGFYFVRNNARTVHFFDQLIRAGDVIEKLRCDQKAMSVMLTEHVSSKGLKVKVLGRDSPEGRAFPGGFHFHNRRDVMRSILLPSTNSSSSTKTSGDSGGPYIFHMSWTKGMPDKVKYLSQMGEWYVPSSCPSAAAGSSSCCSKDPIVQCYYRDVPSKGDCRDYPALTGNRSPFWPNPRSGAVVSTQ